MVNRICSENYRSIDTKKGVLSVSCSGSPVNEYPEGSRLIQKDELRTFLKSNRYTFGVFSEEGYQFNPLNFLNCLQKEIVELGGRIFTNSKVVSMDYLKDLSILKVNDSNFSVSAKRVVFATGGMEVVKQVQYQKVFYPFKLI